MIWFDFISAVAMCTPHAIAPAGDSAGTAIIPVSCLMAAPVPGMKRALLLLHSCFIAATCFCNAVVKMAIRTQLACI